MSKKKNNKKNLKKVQAKIGTTPVKAEAAKKEESKVANKTVNGDEVNVEVKINSYSYDSKTTNLIKTKDSKIIDDSNREIALNYLNSSNLRNRAFQCTGITYDT